MVPVRPPGVAARPWRWRSNDPQAPRSSRRTRTSLAASRCSPGRVSPVRAHFQHLEAGDSMEMFVAESNGPQRDAGCSTLGVVPALADVRSRPSGERADQWPTSVITITRVMSARPERRPCAAISVGFCDDRTTRWSTDVLPRLAAPFQEDRHRSALGDESGCVPLPARPDTRQDHRGSIRVLAWLQARGHDLATPGREIALQVAPNLAMDLLPCISRTEIEHLVDLTTSCVAGEHAAHARADAVTRWSRRASITTRRSLDDGPTVCQDPCQAPRSTLDRGLSRPCQGGRLAFRRLVKT